MKAFDTNAPVTIELPTGWKVVRAEPGWRFKAVVFRTHAAIVGGERAVQVRSVRFKNP